jgi:hypothetical protein
MPRKKSKLDQEFESLATAWLHEHPEIPCEWRHIHSPLWGEHITLVCAPNTAHEFYVGLMGHQIAVGRTNGGHEDFEDFGRGLPEEEVAAEAFEHFLCIADEAINTKKNSSQPSE